MAECNRPTVAPKWARFFTVSLGVIVIMVALAPWSTAFAWDRWIDLEILTVYPSDRSSDQFQRLSDDEKLRYVQKETLRDWPLVNAGITAGEKVNLYARPYSSAGIGSVRLELTGPQTASRTDNSAPYTLFEDFVGTALPAGNYQFSVTAYTEADLGGTAGATYTKSFTLETDSTPPSASMFCGNDSSVSGDAVAVGVRISEPVIGFSYSDFEFTNVRDEFFSMLIKNLRLDGVSNWRFTVEPDVAGTETMIRVPAGAFWDEVGNRNTASGVLHIARDRKVSVADASAIEGTDATIDFEVTLDSRNDCETVTVDWRTADGTATAGEDYTADSGTLTFGPGETSKTVSIAVLDDAVTEGEESFELRLSNSSGATLVGATTSGTITRSTRSTKSNTSGNSDSATATGTITSDDTPAADNDPPTVTITSDAREPVGPGGNVYYQDTQSGATWDTNKFDVTVTFSESVSGFTASDLEVTNATATDKTSSNDGTEYTLTIDPINTGLVTVKVPAGVAVDVGENSNTASSTFDIWAIGRSLTGAPLVTLRCDRRSASSVNLKVMFSKLVRDFRPDDVEITGTSGFGVLSLSGGGLPGSGQISAPFGASFTPEAGTSESAPGQMTFQVPAGAVRDTYGQTNPASNTLRIALNRKVSVGDASATEGADSAMDFEVTLDTVDDCATVTMDWSTEDGTATAGEDYVADSGTLTFGPGETTKTVRVAILDDSKGDDAETFKLRLSNASDASIGDTEATGTISDDATDSNTAPTGLPTISGTARVGETLTASRAGVADDDGLTSATFAWQWSANDGTSDADIADATASTYTLTSAEAGKTIKVRVTFIDDAGTEEALVSAATQAVAEAVQQQVASDTEAPTVTVTSDAAGPVTGEFDVTVTFSEPVLGFAMSELSVTNGSAARMLSNGDGSVHTVTIRPDSGVNGTITVQVPAGVATDAAANANTASGVFGIGVVPALTALFSEVPSSHDGSSAFTVQLDFSEAPKAGIRRIEENLEVTGATLARARRVTRRDNARWTVTLRPSGDGAVAVSLAPETGACDVFPAICTSDGRKLTGTASATVPGPASTPVVSIAAGTSPVTEGAAPVFTLTRTGTTVEALAVDVTVSESGAMLDGTPPVSARFAVGSSTVELSVATADDEVAETASIVMATVSDGGVYSVDADAGSATVTVNDDDAAPTFAAAGPLEVDENTTTIATLTASDADTAASDLSWSLAGGADQDKVTLSAAGALAFKAAKDFEAPDDADADGNYEVTVRVTDGANPMDTSVTVRLVDVDDVAPALSGASVDGATLTLTFGEALDGNGTPASGAFSVVVDGTAREVSGVSVSGSSVTLTLASAVVFGETVRVGYTVPTGDGASPLKDAVGNPVSAFSGEAATNATAAVNNAPTGVPTVSGTAQVGETLTASETGIADADGLTGATFAWQWIANDGTTDVEIAGATGATYRLTAAEEGKTVKVRATFTDDGGTEETLESAATEAIAALPQVSIIGVTASPVTEGTAASFTFSRTGSTTAALTVAVNVSEDGSMVDGTAPSTVTFAADSATATLTVATADDEVAESASVITATVSFGTGHATASVMVEDDDAAPTFAVAGPLEVDENTTAIATLTASDVDTAASDLGWSLAGGADEDKVTLSAAGVLAFKAAKDFEAPDDADADGDYEVTVRVTDGANPVDTSVTVRLVDVDDVAPALSSASVDGTTLALTFGEALDGNGTPASGAFSVVVDGTAREVSGVSLSGSSVTLTLASAVVSGETVTVGYTVPTGASANPLKDGAGNPVAAFSGEAVTNATAAVNNAPTGVPTVSGTARVGETLTASPSAIADADGLANATFAWQWIANDGKTDADIAGATGATYELTSAEEGKTIKVRVTFTDDSGTEETLVSDATAAVGPAALPQVSIRATSSPVTEGSAASFTLGRTGSTTAALTVGVKLSEAGAVLSGTPPSTVTFAAGSAEATLNVATDNDAVDEADARVTASVSAGSGYAVDSAASSAGVDVFDNDQSSSTGATVETLWSSTLEWTDLNGDWLIANAADFTNATWSEDGNDFKVWYFSYDPFGGDLWLRMNSSEAAGDIPRAAELTLHIGDETVEAGDALSAFAAGRIGIVSEVWENWEEGDRVPVRLTRTETTETTASLPGLSVADAQVREADGAALSFSVTLGEAQTGAVSVRYATSNGTAVAGLDYEAVSGMLRFEPGQTSKTVSVPVVDDDHDEGSETLTLTLSQPFGATISDGVATGTIVNTDPMPQAWIARFGRTVAEQVLEAVESRMTAPRAAGVEAILGGQRIGGAVADGGLSLADGAQTGAGRDLADWFANGSDPEQPLGLGSQTMTQRDFLIGSSFSLTGGTEREGTYALWGRGAVTRFDGREGELSLNGEVASAMLGADWSRDALMAGLVVSHSLGEGSYGGKGGAGAVSSSLTGLYPWGRYALSERVSVWGVTGYGEGTLMLTPEGEAPISTDLDLMMAAAGLRGVLVQAPETGGLELAVKTDAMGVKTSTAKAQGLEAEQAEVTRLRLGVEGSRPFRFEGGASLTPTMEIGVRHDGGDAETGFGVDIGGGISWSDPQRGLSAEFRGRGLLSHDADGFRERGFSGSLSWDPTPGTARGLSLTMSQTVGAQAAGGMDALLERNTLAGLVANDDGDSELARRRFEMKVGYGLPAFGDGFTSAPEIGIGFSGERRDYSLGWRLTREARFGGSLDLSLEARREESANDDAAPVHDIAVRVTARW